MQTCNIRERRNLWHIFSPLGTASVSPAAAILLFRRLYYGIAHFNACRSRTKAWLRDSRTRLCCNWGIYTTVHAPLTPSGFESTLPGCAGVPEVVGSNLGCPPIINPMFEQIVTILIDDSRMAAGSWLPEKGMLWPDPARASFPGAASCCQAWFPLDSDNLYGLTPGQAFVHNLQASNCVVRW